MPKTNTSQNVNEKIRLSDTINPRRDELAKDFFKAVSEDQSDPDAVKSLLNQGAYEELGRTDIEGDTIVHYIARYNHMASFDTILRFLSNKFNDDHGELRRKNKAGDTALHIATQYGNREFCNSLLRNGGDLNITNEAGYTPLHIAILKNQHEIMESYLNDRNSIAVWKDNFVSLCELAMQYDNNDKLVKRLFEYTGPTDTEEMNKRRNKVTTNRVRNKEKDSMLQKAVLASNIQMVGDLIQEKVNVDGSQSVSKNTPLYEAARLNNIEIMKMLISQGANVNKGDIMPLYAAVEQNHITAVEYLLQNGADVNGSENYIPLQCAARYGYHLIIQLLLEKQKDMGAQKSHIIQGALKVACESGHLEAVQLLVHAGADLCAAVEGEASPIISAIVNGHLDVLQWALSHQPGLLYFVDSEKNNLLQVAVYADQEAITHFLLEKENKLDEREKLSFQSLIEGGTVLDLAVQERAFKSMYWLLNYRPDLINTTSEAMHLHLAAKRGDTEGINILVRYGAVLNRTDVEGKLPVQYALKNKKFDAVPLLLQWDFVKLHAVFSKLKCVGNYDFSDFFKAEHKEIKGILWSNFVASEMYEILKPYLENNKLQTSITAYLNYQLKRYKLGICLNLMGKNEAQYKAPKERKQNLLDIGMQLLAYQDNKGLNIIDVWNASSLKIEFFDQLPREIQSKITYISNLPAIWTPQPLQAYQPREVAERLMPTLLEMFLNGGAFKNQHADKSLPRMK